MYVPRKAEARHIVIVDGIERRIIRVLGIPTRRKPVVRIPARVRKAVCIHPSCRRGGGGRCFSRISVAAELSELGFDELLDQGAVVVEWGDKLVADAALITFEHVGPERRRIRFERELRR